MNMDQKKMSDHQKAMLVGFMKKNVNLIESEPSTYSNGPEAQILWTRIADELNQIPGATKSWRQWRRSWQYVHRFTTQKLPELQSRKIIGTLTDTQMELLNLVNSTRKNLPRDPADNDIAENLSDEEISIEEEWLEDIDVNDKESELEKFDKPRINIHISNSVLAPIGRAVEILTDEKNVPTPETSSTSFAEVSNPQEIISNLETSVSRNKNNPKRDGLDHSIYEVPKISSDKYLQDRKHELSIRENELKNRERELTSRERELMFRENELKQHNSDFTDHEHEVINRERELIFREREVIRRERELLSREDGLLTLNRGLLEFEKKLIVRAKELEKLQHTIRNRMRKKMKFDSGSIDYSDDDDC